MRSATACVVFAAALASCATAAATSVEGLAGDWYGRLSTSRGHAVARLTISSSGRYEGTAYFDGSDRPFYGAIIALPSGRLRYVSSEGDGSVVLDAGTLHLRGDDGATGASLTRRP